MTIIPKKHKYSIFSTENFSFGTVIVLFVILVLGTRVVENHIHERFKIVGILFIFMNAFFLLSPNNKNYGKNGTQRLLICIKYKVRQFKRKVFVQ